MQIKQSYKMKIFVIGPIIPFTGGISHSNTTLCRNLSKRNDVTAISFSMMFPKLFYPGDKQISGGKLKGVKFKQEFLLNTLNPISWVRIVNKIRKEKPDWVVFQWWHTYFFPGYFFIALFSRLFGAKVNVVCQNVLPHEGGLAKVLIHKPFSKLFFTMVNHLVTLSSSDLKELKSFFKKANADFIIEGTYGGVTGKAFLSKEKALSALKLPKKEIVLFFGAVRPYKDLEMLLRAISIASKKRKNLLLIIAGAFWEPREIYDKMIKDLGIEKFVLIKEGYIPDTQIPLLFKAADVAVLSHKSSTESGIPQLAYAYNTPLIATAVGGNVDLIDDKKTGLLVSAENAEEMAKAIIEFFEKKLHSSFKREMKTKEKLFKWDKEKEKTFFGKK